MYLFYYMASFFTRVILIILTRWEVFGREHVPRTGALILVSNHLNNVDPPVLSASLPRRIVFMAKEELYNARNISGFLTRGFGAFPVRRGEVDRRALRQAVQALERGLLLGLFPEGTRSLKGQMQEAQLGTAWIALESGASILPVAIWGTEEIRTLGDVLTRPHIRVNIGKPFNLPPLPPGKRSAHLPQATQIIMESIAALLPPQYRGVYGGRVAANC
ncbi:MAG: lysophospholipid acyltransferase family protein [Dehalococcoidia bacterium]|nr:lysophospholipid acyltransferase family protein [Dehalococcoidia bacterium]